MHNGIQHVHCAFNLMNSKPLSLVGWCTEVATKFNPKGGFLQWDFSSNMLFVSECKDIG